MLLRRVASSAAGSRRLPGCSSVHLRVPHRCACASTASGGGASGGGQSGGDKERDSEHALPPESVLVRGINEVMRAQPFSCIGYVMACRYAVFFPVVYCVRHFQLAVPTELALAYVLTRPLVKLRFPVELGVAALLSHAFPALTQVKVSALLGLLPTASEAAAARRERPFHTVTDYLVASYPSRTATDPVSSVMARLAGPADRYGAAYYCSRDLVGVSTMLALTAALRSGMDVQGVLEGWGFGAALAGETAASLAAGALVASASSPLYLLSCGHAVPIFAKGVQAIKNEVMPASTVATPANTSGGGGSGSSSR